MRDDGCAKLNASETLNEGTQVTVRATRREDADIILQAFRGLDRESVYRRFFSPKKALSMGDRMSGTTRRADIPGGRINVR
jgi:hypothetical protein